MSDEQKMPIDRLDTELISAGEDMWMIEEVKRDDGPYVLYADHLAAIATITAERRENFVHWIALLKDSRNIGFVVEEMRAQLKEQDDEQ